MSRVRDKIVTTAKNINLALAPWSKSTPKEAREWWENLETDGIDVECPFSRIYLRFEASRVRYDIAWEKALKARVRCKDYRSLHECHLRVPYPNLRAVEIWVSRSVCKFTGEGIPPEEVFRAMRYCWKRSPKVLVKGTSIPNIARRSKTLEE